MAQANDSNSLNVRVFYNNTVTPIEASVKWDIDYFTKLATHILEVPNSSDVGILFAGSLMSPSTQISDWPLSRVAFVTLVRLPSHFLAEQSRRPPPPAISPFFGYCPICQCLQRVFLCVRCAGCRNEQFLLTRLVSTVECLDAAEKSGETFGVCLSETRISACDTNKPEFYFICSEFKNHDDYENWLTNINNVTHYDLRLPFLRQVEQNFDSSECQSCQDSKEIIFRFSCNKDHLVCLDCFTSYVQNFLDELRFIYTEAHGYTLRCLNECPGSEITDPHHFKLLGKQFYERYKDLSTNQFLLSKRSIHCRCGMTWLPTRGILGRGARCETRYGREGCGALICIDCGSRYHGETGDCQTAADEAAEALAVAQRGDDRLESDPVSSTSLKHVVRNCPGCRVRTEKSEGCNHMTCSQCKTEWCWICQIVWSYDCASEHMFSST